jgi:hypothetical protein
MTDAQGRYSFPADRLEPGQYALTVRAVGYDLNAKPTADVVPRKAATVDLKLDKTKNLSHQLSNAEWMMSFPGSEEQKSFLLNCVGCHTLERIARSTHDADEWTQVIHRMLGYAAVSQPIKPQRLKDPERAGRPEQYRRPAEYLATINLSAQTTWQYPLKTQAQGRGDPRDRHRIRSAATHDRAARRRRRCAGHDLVFRLRRALHLEVRPEDAQAHRISDQGIQRRFPGRQPRP